MTGIRNFDLRKINSATKYPSILTFHELGEKGRLLGDLNVMFGGEQVIVTEKIDGTNSRIILFGAGDYIIGSREELLHARGDLIHNPALGIVEAVRPIADKLANSLDLQGKIVVVYGETYGGKTTASKAYGSSIGFRIFDVTAMPYAHPNRGSGNSHEIDFAGLMNMELEAISRWRENGGQLFLDEQEIQGHASMAGVGVTPRLQIAPGIGGPPADLIGCHAWLKTILPGNTNAPLEGDLKGKPEGVVVRTRDRSKIAKIRFEDYERTLR